MKRQSAAIYYEPEAYSMSDPFLKGRQAAGASFLDGYLKYSEANDFFCYVRTKAQGLAFNKKVERRPRATSNIITFGDMPKLQEPALLFYPGPSIADLSFQRSCINPTGWSLCGITHTTSSKNAMDAITSILSSALEPWDAIICTSSAVKTHVTNILHQETERLSRRLGIRNMPLPQLPTIPLGINTEDFISSGEEVTKYRKKLDIDDDSITVLYMGRLSFHGKANPVAMYLALERATVLSSKKVNLIECGWFANQYIKNAFEKAAKKLCPSVNIIRLDGRETEIRKMAWAAADIFCSLSDNIQETFGITPIEAMAAKLPLVVSDWNGYKESVRHKIDGFRVKTTSPAPGLGGDLAMRYALNIDSYDLYTGYSCMHNAIDIEQATQFLLDLFTSKQLRETMGKNGQKRALSIYDWKVIIPKYEKLWKKLSILRKEANQKHPHNSKPKIWPARMDPFLSFSHYPSQTLKTSAKLQRVIDDEKAAIEHLNELLALDVIGFAQPIFLQKDDLSSILKSVSPKGIRVREILTKTSLQGSLQLRALSILQKLGLIRSVGD